MSDTEDFGVNFYERTYTLTQLSKLRECIESNKTSFEPLTSALSTFIYSGYNEGNTDVLFWLRFAEKIQKDPEYPERDFDGQVNTIRTYFVITPSAT